MRRSVAGVRQLGQALRDYANELPIRALDEDGNVRLLADGSGEQTVNDVYLRNEFPPPGKPKVAAPGTTPTDRYNHALGGLASAVNALEQAFAGLCRVTGDDGQPLVEGRGVETRLVDPWREQLKRIEDEMGFWARTFRKAMGVRSATSAYAPEGEADDVDPYADQVEDDEEPAVQEESDDQHPQAA